MEAAMKTEKRREGDYGEELACRYLTKKNYHIIERNYSCKTGEVDIIASDGDLIAFIEVKTRHRTDYGYPCEAVDRKKQLRLVKTAQFYLKTHTWYAGLQPRMDIIEILLKGDDVFIRHLENAFS